MSQLDPAKRVVEEVTDPGVGPGPPRRRRQGVAPWFLILCVGVGVAVLGFAGLVLVRVKQLTGERNDAQPARPSNAVTYSDLFSDGSDVPQDSAVREWSLTPERVRSVVLGGQGRDARAASVPVDNPLAALDLGGLPEELGVDAARLRVLEARSADAREKNVVNRDPQTLLVLGPDFEAENVYSLGPVIVYGDARVTGAIQTPDVVFLVHSPEVGHVIGFPIIDGTATRDVESPGCEVHRADVGLTARLAESSGDVGAGD